MDDPHDDTDVPSGTTDGAQMESTSPPVLRLHGDHRQEDEGSPVPTSSSSAPTAARTLDTAATEESSFTVEAATPAARLGAFLGAFFRGFFLGAAFFFAGSQA